MKRFLSGAVFFLAAFFALAATAQEAPDLLVRNVTNEVLAIVKQDKDLQNGNTRRAVELVEAKVLPNFNFTRMTSLAVGRDWNKASPQQKEQLVREFRTLLVRTYSNALTQFKNQTVDFKPLKMQAADSEVTVRTIVNQPGQKPIELDYSLEKQAGTWKVYDVIVAGVSLVTNYRDMFGNEVRNGGIDGLVKALAAKNSKNAEKK
jgi:phospholipid transport system substrate-binding protein